MPCLIFLLVIIFILKNHALKISCIFRLEQYNNYGTPLFTEDFILLSLLYHVLKSAHTSSNESLRWSFVFLQHAFLLKIFWVLYVSEMYIFIWHSTFNFPRSSPPNSQILVSLSLIISISSLNLRLQKGIWAVSFPAVIELENAFINELPPRAELCFKLCVPWNHVLSIPSVYWHFLLCLREICDQLGFFLSVNKSVSSLILGECFIQLQVWVIDSLTGD